MPTGTFVGFERVVPGRRFQLIEFIPPKNVDEDESGELRAFIACLQEVVDLLLSRIDRWVEIIDPDVAPIPFVDLMLEELGNPFAFELTDIQKRRLVTLLVPIYKSKGTRQGIINTIRLFLGLEVSIVLLNGAAVGLDAAQLGGPGMQGSFFLSGEGRTAYSYKIISPTALTDLQRSQIREIAEYMQPSPEHLHAIVEPQSPDGPIDHLSLGFSQLDVNWKLH
ncbi:MAG: phage tail protein [Polyangiaceae bacterium]|nr:phage tail protein [Polyangiaceae bacterium]